MKIIKVSELQSYESYKDKLNISIKNRILYGLIYAEKIPFNLLAQKLDVETDTLIEWCFEGKIPNKKIREDLADYFDLPEQILFWEAKH